MGEEQGESGGAEPQAAELDATLRPGRPEERWLDEALGINTSVASRVAGQLGRREVADELESAGRLALVTLLRRYQPERASLRGYLLPRLRWAMLDAVRRDSRGRALARRAHALAASQHLSDAAAEPETGAPLMDEQGYRRALGELLRQHATALGLALVGPGDEEPRVASTLQPDRVVSKRRRRDRLRRAIDTLGEPRERELVVRHYYQGASLSAVAATMGISRSWASRLHARAIAALARSLGDGQALR